MEIQTGNKRRTKGRIKAGNERTSHCFGREGAGAFVDAPLSSSTHDMALVSTLEKAEDIAVYGSHPAHVAVADTYVRPYVTERACLDY